MKGTLMMLCYLMVLTCLTLLWSGNVSAEAAEEEGTPSITVLYDNNNYDTGLTSDWGFACLIRGFEQTILFDTGAKGKILLENMRKLQIDPAEIDVIVLSHWHPDHVGGLDQIIKVNKNVKVYLVNSLFGSIERKLQKNGIAFTKVTEKMEICPQVYTTGVINGSPDEQAMVLRTLKGDIVITGCAHPGIANIVQVVQQDFTRDLLLVMGGFHLKDKKQEEVEQTVRLLQQSGVQSVAPTHCTGPQAIQIFREQFQEKCLTLGVGKTIFLESL